jgi:hypothetical protein
MKIKEERDRKKDKVKIMDIKRIFSDHDQPSDSTLLSQKPPASLGLSASKITMTALGILTGMFGLEHGILESLQGNVVPTGLLIGAIGAPCQMEKAWNGCEPALTVIPSMRITGILAIIASLLVITWSALFIYRKNGALIFGLLSLLLFPVGGGFVPPLFGIITAVSAGRIKPKRGGETNAPLNRINRILAKTWPWPLIGFFVWSLAEWIVDICQLYPGIGIYFYEGLTALAMPVFLLTMGLLLLSIISCFARDKG